MSSAISRGLPGNRVEVIGWSSPGAGFPVPLRLNGTVTRVHQQGRDTWCLVGDEGAAIHFPRSAFKHATIHSLEDHGGSFALQVVFIEPMGMIDIGDRRITFRDEHYLLPVVDEHPRHVLRWP